MRKEIEHISILEEGNLSLEVMQWVNRINEIAVRVDTTGYLKGGLLRDYISNIFNQTSLDTKDLDIMLLGKVNLVVNELIKEGAAIKLRRNRRKTPVFEMLLPTAKGPIDADIGIVLGKPYSYVKDQKPDSLILDDALLSDFTVNTLFLPIDKPLVTANLIDPLGGAKDIVNRIIRMVSPNTFVRNPECMLRAVRMADRLTANIETNTFESIQRYAQLIQKAPKPVVDQNMTLILASPNRAKNLDLLKKLGLFYFL